MAGSEGKELKIRANRESIQKEDNPEVPDRGASPEGAGENAPSAPGEQRDTKGAMTRGEYLLIALTLLLVVTVVGGGMFIWARYGTFEGEEKAAAAHKQGHLYRLNPFFVPLKAQANAEKFLRVTISLELAGEDSSRLVARQMGEIRGTLLQMLLSAVPRDFEYPHGKKALLDRMKTSLNHFLGKDLVQGVQFNNAVLL